VLLTSCSEKQYLQVIPGVRGISKYGLLSAEEFPLLVCYLFLGFVYSFIAICLIISIYCNKSFIGILHFIFLATIVSNIAYFFVEYKIKERENIGQPSIFCGILKPENSWKINLRGNCIKFFNVCI